MRHAGGPCCRDAFPRNVNLLHQVRFCFTGFVFFGCDHVFTRALVCWEPRQGPQVPKCGFFLTRSRATRWQLQECAGVVEMWQAYTLNPLRCCHAVGASSPARPIFCEMRDVHARGEGASGLRVPSSRLVRPLISSASCRSACALAQFGLVPSSRGVHCLRLSSVGGLTCFAPR